MTSNSKQALFSYSTLVHAIAGGCGSAVAMTAFYPLDVIRTRQQLEKEKNKAIFAELSEIYQTDGLPGLYNGLLPVIQSLYCSNFVYFYTFHGLKRLGNSDKSLLKDLLLGMVAGWVNVLTTTPLWVVNTRIKMQRKTTDEIQENKFSGLLDGLRSISRTQGVLSLWSGTLSSLILVINPAIQFMVYEAIKRNITRIHGSDQLNSITVFLAGAVAKAISTVITYPLQLVQTNQRHGKKSSEQHKGGIISMILYIIELQGAKGLYKGLQAKILQTVLTTALMFVCYEKIAAIVFSLLLGQKKMNMVKQN